jgi:hypothetical protein
MGREDNDVTFAELIADKRQDTLSIACHADGRLGRFGLDSQAVELGS